MGRRMARGIRARCALALAVEFLLISPCSSFPMGPTRPMSIVQPQPDLLLSRAADKRGASSPPAPRATTNPEHVVLADCRDTSNVLSSMMAYFPNAPGAKPQDIAPVTTPPGQTRVWENSETKALFSTTSTTFTADLGPLVDINQYAGNGSNNYGPFTCWRRYTQDLYKYNSFTCSMVYDCDHEATPSVLPTPLSTNTPTPTPSGNPGGGGLSTGAEVAIIVSVAAAVIIGIAAGALLWFKRRSQKQKNKPRELDGTGIFGGVAASPRDKDKPKDSYANSQGYQQVYEMDGQWGRVEANPDAIRAEMEGVGRPAEIMDERHRYSQIPGQGTHQSPHPSPYQQYAQQPMPSPSPHPSYASPQSPYSTIPTPSQGSQTPQTPYSHAQISAQNTGQQHIGR